MSDSKIPGAASSWTRATLDALNASFDRHMVARFVFDRDRLAIPTDLQQRTSQVSILLLMANVACIGIDALADAFSNVNNSDRITPQYNFYPSPDHPLMHFGDFYEQLSLILTRDQPPNHGSRERPLNTNSRTQIVLPSSPTTPPPSPTPINPQYSSGSSATASSAAEEKDEHYTHSFANAFVYASQQSLRNWLESFAWYRDTQYKLRRSYAAQR